MKRIFRYLIVSFLFMTSFSVTILSQSGNWKNFADKAWYDETDTIFFLNSPAQLAGLAELVNSGISFVGKRIVLESIIDLKAHYWTPIGTDSRSFRGRFDGNFYSIKGLYINTSTSVYNYDALFGNINSAVISNLGIESGTVTSKASSSSFIGVYAAGLVARGSNSSLYNCSSLVNVSTEATHSSLGLMSASAYAGGLVGYGTDMDIKHCSNLGKIVSKAYCEKSITNTYAGGITGYFSGNIYASYNFGIINGVGSTCVNFVYAGGIVGECVSGMIQYAENRGVVNASSVSSSATGDPYSGGIAGVNSGTIINCSNWSNIGCQENSTNPTAIHIGGIAGDNRNSIVNSYSICTLSGDAKPYTLAEINIGGISGTNTGKIINSYSITDFMASAITLNKGGIAGKGSGTVSNCYYLVGYATGKGTALPLTAFQNNTLTQYLNDYIDNSPDSHTYSYWAIEKIYPDFTGKTPKQKHQITFRTEYENHFIEAPQSVLAGEVVYFNVQLSSGQELKSVYITGVEVKQIDSLHYSFTMPDYDVEIVLELQAASNMRNISRELEIYTQGNELIINSNEEKEITVFLVNGHAFGKYRISRGCNRIILPQGIYALNGTLIKLSN